MAMLGYTVANYRPNNRQMEALSVAQRCFRNALVVIVVGGCITSAVYMSAAVRSEPGCLQCVIRKISLAGPTKQINSHILS